MCHRYLSSSQPFRRPHPHLNTKIEYGTYCETTASPRSIKLEATFTFAFCILLLFAMKSTVAYVLNTFDDEGGLIDTTDSDDTAWFKSTMNWFVKGTFSSLSTSFDSLFDRDDKMLLQGFGDSQDHRAEEKLNRSLESTKKQLKNELKSLSSALNQGMIDMESQNRDALLKLEEKISFAVSSAILQSQQTILQAIQGDDVANGCKTATGNLVDASEVDDSFSDTSISLGHK